jgi:prepilin-type processing-associated H-X9-DG protein
MPRITDIDRVRATLDRDRTWSAYAIGDLAPEFAAACAWHAPLNDSSALILLYEGFHPPIVFATGDPHQLAPLFHEIDASVVSLHVRTEVIAAMATRYRAMNLQPMWRMVVDPVSFRSAVTTAVVSLDESDTDAVNALYADGHARGEGPTFFQPWMLRQGTFRGIREGADLVAVAGTHLFSRELGVCAIGNVYTRSDRRRRGLGAAVTSAVVRHAIAQDVATIVLNVSHGNAAARRVYEQLGFGCHCDFVEGEAEQVSRTT